MLAGEYLERQNTQVCVLVRSVAGSRAEFVAVSVVVLQNFAHIALCFFVRRDPAVFVHSAFACIVRSDRQYEIAFEPVGEHAEVTGAAHDVLLWVEGVLHAHGFARTRHKLHQTLRACVADDGRVEVAFHAHHRSNE